MVELMLCHRQKQNAVPPFPLTIGPRNFDTVKEYLTRIGYDGPVALSCDDTKLHAAFRTYWDAEKQVHMLVGGTGDPMAVADPEELQRVLAEPTLEKATKVFLTSHSFDQSSPMLMQHLQLRLWCAQIPLSKFPPIIVAVKAIPNSLSVQDLHALLTPVLEGLLTRGIPICSYACDGTETERSLQRRLVEKAPYRVTYSIPIPSFPASLEPVSLSIAVYHGRPIVMIQDAKHALKTYRNNMFSGARFLVIGNGSVTYDTARELAFHDDSPLYHRDVEKVDRQDDNAATRLFSPTALEYLTKRAPNRVAQTLYVFNMGEAVDAYINPEIKHIVRIKMVLRTRFFVDIWRSYLRATGYAESRYFISREAADITRILVDGLIGLVIVYRDHQDGSTRTPLLPWLHSTEVCEHVFAECRKLVADFTYLDFIYMHPRLQVILRSIVRFLHTSDPKARAAGYAHTYFDPERVDLAELAIFPTDSEIQQAAQEAWEEAESLFALVGVVPSDFLSAPGSADMSSRLPSISSWFFNCPTSDPDLSPHSPDLADESEISSDEEEEDNDEEDIPAKLQHVIDANQGCWDIQNDGDHNRFLNLTCAAVAVAMDDAVTA